ncbi:hypothetical protein C8J56DRAFT_1026962 [Mycena floridula]|nr:hypothetical protein C8J56DRAFT_1026962 [Mycena floridula]
MQFSFNRVSSIFIDFCTETNAYVLALFNVKVFSETTNGSSSLAVNRIIPPPTAELDGGDTSFVLFLKNTGPLCHIVTSNYFGSIKVQTPIRIILTWRNKSGADEAPTSHSGAGQALPLFHSRDTVLNIMSISESITGTWFFSTGQALHYYWSMGQDATLNMVNVGWSPGLMFYGFNVLTTDSTKAGQARAFSQDTTLSLVNASWSSGFNIPTMAISEVARFIVP